MAESTVAQVLKNLAMKNEEGPVDTAGTVAGCRVKRVFEEVKEKRRKGEEEKKRR
jgi:hypothetical protein